MSGGMTMIEEHKFYFCKHCGNIVGMINYGGEQMTCCGEVMKELIPNSTEASTEKHLPVITTSGNTVTVTISSVLHPMTSEHHIEWVYLLTKAGGQRKALPVDGEPIVTFALTEDDAPIAAFAYCNLHGLWKTSV